MLIEEQSPEEMAAEAAAFESAFHDERGEKTEPETPVAEAPVVEPATQATDEPVVEPATPAAEEPPAEQPKPVLAGLTEDQVAQALARVSQQQSTIDKLGGRIGQLMQQVEALKTQPRTAGDRQQFDLKLEKLGNAFPELAELLREDLKDISAGSGDAPAQAAEVFTADDVNRIVTEKLTSFQQQQERGIEVRMLSTAHPDWQDTIKTPQFALWRDNVITDGKDLMESESASFISLRLTQFKDWVKTTTVAPTPQAAPTPNTNRQRLANAVLPKGTMVTTPTEQTEEDAFMSAFKAERSKSGH
jgi:hypothetical protein